MSLERIHVVVRGRVQGVGFRYAAVEQARRLGLRGWVRNRADGAVELAAAGPADAVAALLDWVAQGPPLARVHEVRHEPLAAEESLEGEFRVRR
jgi:acylphosphatase